MSWGWRKLLQLRDIVKPYFWKQVGNGHNTSLWHDRWCLQGPLVRLLSPRDIAREGYTLQTHVADLVVNGAWNFPLSWLAKAPILSTLYVPMLTEHEDSVYWRDSNGLMSTFSVKCAWEALRPRGLEVWSLVRILAGMESVPPGLEDIVNWLRPMAAKRSFKSVVGKLLFASTTYFVWCERNNRLFKNIRRSPKELKDQIMVVVRLKLINFRFKNKLAVSSMLAKWKLPNNFRLSGS
nr:hypothetical protein [Tanacetum cinerariifolium]